MAHEKLLRLLNLVWLLLAFPTVVAVLVGFMSQSPTLGIKTFLLIGFGIAILSPLLTAHCYYRRSGNIGSSSPAVEVSVSVTGEADPQRVVELLQNTVAAHPGVADEPSLHAYIVNFSAGAVTFQLRAWRPRLKKLHAKEIVRRIERRNVELI